MDNSQTDIENLRQEIKTLHQSLAEVQEKLRLAEETLEAIHSGEVDALVVATNQGTRVFTLQGVDYIYQCLVEQMGEGAATLSSDGLILYCNQRLSELLNCPLPNLIGSPLETFINPQDRKAFLRLLQQVQEKETITLELSLITATENKEVTVKLSLKQLKIDELLVNSIVITDITRLKQAEIVLQEQIARERLVTSIAQNIRQTLELDEVLQRTVTQVRELLQTKRVIVFRCEPNGQGTVISESLASGCTSMLSKTFDFLYFTKHYLKPEQQGQFYLRADLHAPEVEPCCRELLEPFQVRAMLAVSISQAQELWGFLMVHECYHPRQWQQQEIELLQQLAIHVGIAIQQSELYEQTSQELLERQKVQKSLTESEFKYRILFESNPNPLWVVDLETLAFVAVNRDAIAHYGYSEAEFLSMTMADIYPCGDLTSVDELRDNLSSEKSHWGVWRHKKKDGSLINVEISAHPFFLVDQSVALVVINDITERLQAQELIEHLAFYDPLTNLPNRHLLFDRLENALSLAQRSGKYGALLFVDLDRFKTLNDARGHAVGDLLLQEVATRLKDCLRESDTVARFGGDEFVVVLPELSDEQQLAARLSLNMGGKICARLAAPFLFQGEEITIGASIGITLFPKARETETVNDLLKEADTAMYQAKASGRNTACLFETKMQVEVEFRFVLEGEIRRALEENQFRVYLQPQVDKEGCLVGAEALIRWQHPIRGIISPSAFIPIAEETGLIVPMGEWILQETCHYLSRIQASGFGLHISVNVSPCQFRQPTFIPHVKAIVAATTVDPTCLTLEVTEGSIIGDIDQAIATMAELQILGIHFSIDDFGTGYSSLAYLKRLPLNELKIDQSFVQDTPHDPNDAALVEAIISIARHFNFGIVAEGVETIEQADFLKERGCDFYQGYLYGKPIPISEFDLMVKALHNPDRVRADPYPKKL